MREQREVELGWNTLQLREEKKQITRVVKEGGVVTCSCLLCRDGCR